MWRYQARCVVDGCSAAVRAIIPRDSEDDSGCCCISHALSAGFSHVYRILTVSKQGAFLFDSSLSRGWKVVLV